MEENSVKIGGIKLSPKMIFVIGIAGIVLIGLSSVLGGEKSIAPTEDYYSQTKLFVKETETRIAEMLKKTSGVGRASVMITTENGAEYIYAKDEKQIGTENQQSVESKYILIDGSTGKRQALVLTQLEPKIKGVVVVCDGGNDHVVRQRVNDIVTTSLGINSLQVCILKLSE